MGADQDQANTLVEGETSAQPRYTSDEPLLPRFVFNLLSKDHLKKLKKPATDRKGRVV